MAAEGREARSWQVLLIGGPSGVGKTSVSYRIARHFGVGITEIDDFHHFAEALTTPAQQPAIHFWNTHPAPDALGEDEILDRLLATSDAMMAGLERVIANHLETDTPLVLEGDYILPSLAARTHFHNEPNRGRVRAVFLHEPEEARILANYLAREPKAGPQVKRARVSRLHGAWLEREAGRLGMPLVKARPWETVLERVIAAAA